MNELTDYEKMIEAVHQIAKLMRNYYNALLEEGFDPGEAMKLALAYQNTFLTVVFTNGAKGGGTS